MPSKKSQKSPPPPKRIYRSETDRVIAGVAAGLAEYLAIDPVVVRLLFLVITISGGAGVIIYIFLWIFLPTKSNLHSSAEESIKLNAEEIKHKAEAFAQTAQSGKFTKTSSRWFGIVVLTIGIMLLLNNLHIFRFKLFWPLIIIFVGIALLRKR